MADESSKDMPKIQVITDPGGVEAQKARLEAEGHTITTKGRTNIRYFVKDYEKALFELD